MDRSELVFRDGCRRWHTYFERCANDGRTAEVPHLIGKIAQYLDAWKESLAAARRETVEAEKRALECRQKEASIQLRLRMLGELRALMDRNLVERERVERKAAARTRQASALDGQVTALLDKAERLRAAGDIRGAIEHTRRALTLVPDHDNAKRLHALLEKERSIQRRREKDQSGGDNV
jgi:tetratricopeptide (TPR) repeat protein